MRSKPSGRKKFAGGSGTPCHWYLDLNGHEGLAATSLGTAATHGPGLIESSPSSCVQQNDEHAVRVPAIGGSAAKAHLQAQPQQQQWHSKQAVHEEQSRLSRRGEIRRAAGDCPPAMSSIRTAEAAVVLALLSETMPGALGPKPSQKSPFDVAINIDISVTAADVRRLIPPAGPRG